MKILNSRVGLYVTFGLMYWIFWKIFGFELNCIVRGGTIISKQAYLQHKNKKNE